MSAPRDSPQSARDFVPSDFFMLRTPLLPFDEFLRWGEMLEAAGSDPGQLDASLPSDRARLRARLREIVARPDVREALFVASPGLEESLDHWWRDAESERGRRVEQALVRYFSRMTGRATPFGLFAGCSVGTVDPAAETRLETAGRDLWRRHTRLDMHYVSALALALAADPAVRRAVVYRPNTSLHRVGGRLCYAERSDEDGKRLHRLVALDESEELAMVIGAAAGGATHARLVEIVAAAGIDREEAEGFVDEIVDSQIVVPDFGPTVTGPEPIPRLIEELGAVPGMDHVVGPLREAQAALEAIDRTSPGIAPAKYRSIARALEPLPAPVDLSRLFQVDLVKPAPQAVLGGDVLRELARGVALLSRLGPARATGDLARFRTAFRERYEHREVPLLEALDHDVGIGFPVDDDGELGPLLKGLDFPTEPPDIAEWGARERLLLAKLLEATARGDDEIALGEEDLKIVAAERPEIPDGFAAMATVLGRSAEAVARGDFRIVVRGTRGPSSARIFGRFCHGDDDLARRLVRTLRAEEALEPEAIHAEVVHEPEGRFGNILLRPVLRRYEIPYLARSSVPSDFQIPLGDLMLSIDRGGGLRLRSVRHGRRVIPHLGSAHNVTHHGIGAYRFLCSLEGDGREIPSWRWGALEKAPFLPRVVSGRVVLAPATWRLSSEEIARLAKEHGAARFRAVAELRRVRRLPRFVVVADYDNHLPVDLENTLSVESFVRLLKGREDAVLEELPAGEGLVCASSPEGRFVHEILVPFVRSAPIPASEGWADDSLRAPVRLTRPIERPARAHPPGSEWLYAKLYCGASTADRVIRDVAAPVAASALASGAADRWFFIRYWDPQYHVRLRIRGNPDELAARVLMELRRAAAPLLEDGSVSRLQLDTYEPEIERYGGPAATDVAERIFHADSDAVVELLGLLEGDQGEVERWRIALASVDALLSDLGLDDEAKQRVVEKARGSFAAEHRADTNLKRQLGLRYLEERSVLERLLDERASGNPGYAPGLAVLAERSRRLAPIAAELSAGVTELSWSLVHMSLNRLLRSSHRRQEMVLYDFLARLYATRAAKQKRSGRLAER